MMEIIAEKIPDEPVAARSDSLEEAQLNATVHATTLEQPTLTREMTTTPQEAPTPKKRGRPPGSRNKPKVIEESPLPEPVIMEPEVEEQEEEYEEPPPPPPKQRKPRAPKSKV